MNDDQTITAEEALAKTYNEEVVVERVVPTTASEAYSKFQEFVWLRNGGESAIGVSRIREKDD